MQSIHWLDPSGKAERNQVCRVDFPDRAMAAEFGFALYAAVHGFARDRLGFAVHDAAGATLHEWRRDGHINGIDVGTPDNRTHQAETAPIAADRHRAIRNLRNAAARRRGPAAGTRGTAIPDRIRRAVRPVPRLVGQACLIALFGRRANAAKRVIPATLRFAVGGVSQAFHLGRHAVTGFASGFRASLAILSARPALPRRAHSRQIVGAAAPSMRRRFAPEIVLRPTIQPSLLAVPVSGLEGLRQAVARGSRSVAAAAASRFDPRSIAWRPDVDQCILAAVFVAVILCGSPLYSIYSAARGVESDEAIALQDRDALAADTWYGVNDALTTDAGLDFRKIFWHLRVMGPTEVDLLAYDPMRNGDGPRLVFTTRNFLRWHLHSVRGGGREIAASSLDNACHAS